MEVKIKVVLSKEYSHKPHFVTTVFAEDETKAIQKAIKEADGKGVILPDEIWTRTEKL